MSDLPGYSPRPFVAPSAPGWRDPSREWPRYVPTVPTPPAPDPDLVVKLGPITFSTSSGFPSSGWRIGLRRNGLKGWRTFARDNTDSTPHPAGVGQVTGILTVEARPITIAAVITAAAPSGVDAALDYLCGRRRAVLVVDEVHRGLCREANVRVLQIQETQTADRVCDVTIHCVADDSRRYSSEQHTLTNGANVLANRGPAAAFPLIDLTGPHSAISIKHSGGTLVCPPLGSGVHRRIDCRNGAMLAMPAGSRLWGDDAPDGPWPRVTDGGETWTISGLDSGTASATRTEAWT